MTETTTEITPLIKAGRIALAKKDADLSTVARAISGVPSTDLVAVEAKPAKLAKISGEQEAAVAEVVELAKNISIPSTVRPLKEGERANLIAARLKFDAAEKVITDSKDAIKQALHNHFDKVAEAAGVVDETTPRNKEGHYVLEDKEHGSAEGQDKKFTREVSAGGTTFGEIVTEADRLKQLVDDGLLDHEVYLKVTKQTRIVDEHALFLAIKADDSLLPVINQALVAKASSASICVRKAD